MSIRTLVDVGHQPASSLARERLLNCAPGRSENGSPGPGRIRFTTFTRSTIPIAPCSQASCPNLIARYDIDVVPHAVGPPPDSAAPEREKLIAYSRKDARLLARHWNLVFDDLIGQPRRISPWKP